VLAAPIPATIGTVTKLISLRADRPATIKAVLSDEL
jgi:hypothetical protein